MKFSKNSWHTKIYQLTFANGSLPNNLCPYFWKLVVAIIVFVLWGWFYIPAFIANRIVSKIEKEDDKLGAEKGFFSIFFGIALAINFILYLLLSCVLFWIYPHDQIWQLGGALTATLLTVIGIILLVEWRKRIREKNPKKTAMVKKKPNIFVEFVKAKYNRYCPKIEWQSEK